MAVWYLVLTLSNGAVATIPHSMTEQQCHLAAATAVAQGKAAEFMCVEIPPPKTQ